MHATGTPDGICTIESSESMPPRSDVFIGTPITGSSVYAAITPGRAAALPAPAMMTRTPRSAAVEEYSATPRGSRWADSTFISNVIARSSSSSAAACMTSLSDSDPIRIPTCGPSVSSSAQRCLTSGAGTGSGMHVLQVLGRQGDVGAVHASLQVDQVDGGVGSAAGLGEVGPGCRHVEDAAAGSDQRAIVLRRPCVEDRDPLDRAGRLDPGDRAPDLRRLVIAARGDHDAHAGGAELARREVAQRAGRGPVEQVEQVSVEAREDHLRLGVAEPG